MSSGHEQQINMLFIFAGILLAVIFTAIIVSAWKNILRKTKVTELPEATPSPNQTPLAHFDSTGQVVSDIEIPNFTFEAKTIVEEKAIDLKAALKKTEENLFGRIRHLFKNETSHQHLDEIEEILYTSDLGPVTVQRLMEAIKSKLSKKEHADYETVRDALKEEIKNIFASSHSAAPDQGLMSKIHFAESGPTVLMIVGVNGAGKTTSIGKISAQFASQGKKVLVAAGDTFRAAAGGQLKVWTDRAQVEIFSPDGVTDPSAVAFEAVAKGKAQGYDIVIVDTAGRLHTQANLMEEIKKMKRVMGKVISEAPHETLIVLDANSGQNALMQAKEFHNALVLTGAILTKMDGTAKGGVAVGLAQELQIPIKLIGVGERIQDLRTFSSEEFVNSLFQ